VSEPKCPPGFVTKSELFSAFEEAGVSISDHRLERWRSWSLLPAVLKPGKGYPGGSVVFYPETTIDQAIEANRIFSIKRNKHFVGFELWWRGFDVDEKYWRLVIEGCSEPLPRFRRKIMRLLFAAKENDEVADKVYSEYPKRIAPKPVKQNARNISQEDFSDAIITLLKVLASKKDDPENLLVLDEADQRSRAIQNFLGFSQSGTDKVLSQKLHVTPSIISALKAIASVRVFPKIDHAFFQGENFQRFLSAKNDVRGILEIARNMHEALSWIYGPRAFGLKVARWFHDNAPPASKAELALLWMCAREEFPEEFYSSELISDMLANSRDIVWLSAQLRAAIQSSMQLTAICTPKKLKKAFSNEDELAVFCAELRQLTT